MNGKTLCEVFAQEDLWPRPVLAPGGPPRILIGCEQSGTVRDAFIAEGFDAWSCDLNPSERPGPHIIGDVRRVLGWGWTHGIFHPPCTYVAVSGMHWTKRGLRPAHLTEEALDLVRTLLAAPIPFIALENPVSVISTRIRKPDQIIQPWMFGHPESKTTCLWLVGLPKLVPTDILPWPASGRWDNQTPSGQNKLGPSPTRAMRRARTYQGIGKAMAQQWGIIT